MFSIGQKIKNALNAAISAAIGGAALAVVQVFTDTSHIDVKHIGPVAIGGAILGLANHYRTPPTIQAQSAQQLAATPAGKIAQAENTVVGAVADKITETAKEKL